MLGRPEGIERLGGVDFDDAVFSHVRNSVGEALDRLDPADEEVLAAVARLRRDCVEAKEALSADTEVRIPVLLPGLQTTVRLVRGEFEEMIRDDVEASVEVAAPSRRVRGCRAGGPHRGPAGRWLVPDPARRTARVGGARPSGRRRRRSEERDRARCRPGRHVRPGSGPHGGTPGRRPHDPGSRRRDGHRRDPPARAVAPARAGSRRSDRGAASRRGHAARRRIAGGRPPGMISPAADERPTRTLGGPSVLPAPRQPVDGPAPTAVLGRAVGPARPLAGGDRRRRRPVGAYLGAGGLLVAAALAAAVSFWPDRPATTPTGSLSSTLLPVSVAARPGPDVGTRLGRGRRTHRSSRPGPATGGRRRRTAAARGAGGRRDDDHGGAAHHRPSHGAADDHGARCRAIDGTPRARGHRPADRPRHRRVEPVAGGPRSAAAGVDP